MSNNTLTLAKAIKRELRILDLKWVFTVFGLIGVAFATGLMVLLYLAGLPPKGLLVMLFPTYGSALFTSGIAIGCLIGTAITIAFFRYSKQKVKPYVNIPKDVDELRNGLIGLGSYIASRDNASKDTYESFNESWKTRIRDLESNDSDKEQIIKQQQQKIIELETKLQGSNEWKDLAWNTAGRFSIESFANKWKVLRLENKIKDLTMKYTDLKSEINILKREKSVEKQQIGEKAHAEDINENTKIDDKHKKFERKN